MVTPGWLEALPTSTTTGVSQSWPNGIVTLICITPGTVPLPTDIGITGRL